MNKETLKPIFFKYDRGLIPVGTDLHVALTYIKELEKENERLTHQQRVDGQIKKNFSTAKRGRPKKDRVREGSSSRPTERTSKDSTMEGG